MKIVTVIIIVLKRRDESSRERRDGGNNVPNTRTYSHTILFSTLFSQDITLNTIKTLKHEETGVTGMAK